MHRLRQLTVLFLLPALALAALAARSEPPPPPEVRYLSAASAVALTKATPPPPILTEDHGAAWAAAAVEDATRDAQALRYISAVREAEAAAARAAARRAAAAAAAASRPSSSSSSSPSAPAPAGGAGVWDRLAQCESGGNWSINTGNGYRGGLQMDATFWRSYGGLSYAPHPDQASRSQQIDVAVRARDSGRGYRPWPTCARKLGLL